MSSSDPLEEQDNHVVRIEIGPSVTNVHTNTVNDVLAVCFDDELPPGLRRPAEQASQRRLGTRMQMQFGLLHEQHGMRPVRDETGLPAAGNI